MFKVVDGLGVMHGETFEDASDAAQEAEYLHAKYDARFTVVKIETDEEWYESSGAPE